MKIKPIRNEADYQKALERIEVIFDAKKGTEEGDELEILAIVIDNYENENFPIECQTQFLPLILEWNKWA
jgi:HTH-type transcriptional regulator/antitoxin HigA